MQNFMDLALDGAIKKHGKDVKSDISQSDLEKDYIVASRVVREILTIFNKHEVSPMQGYMIAGALSDAIYSMLVETDVRESLNRSASADL